MDRLFVGGNQEKIWYEWRLDQFDCSVSRTACYVTFCMNGVPWNCCSVEAQSTGKRQEIRVKGKSRSDCEGPSMLSKGV